MRFSEDTKRAARWRQMGRCGICGENLDWLEEHAHHIFPNALGGPDAVDNCVILCWDCHCYAHAWSNYRSGVVAPRSLFRYLSG